MEEQLIRLIENGIRAVKLGNKTPQEVSVNNHLARLKVINVGMAEDLQKKYVEVVKNLKQ
jgi:hypothetical protein